MTDKEFERIISFIVNENIIRRLLNSVDQSDKLNVNYTVEAKFDIKNIQPTELIN